MGSALGIGVFSGGTAVGIDVGSRGVVAVAAAFVGGLAAVGMTVRDVGLQPARMRVATMVIAKSAQLKIGHHFLGGRLLAE
jgi:hypothetical protein